jgi:hypothetical protein
MWQRYVSIWQMFLVLFLELKARLMISRFQVVGVFPVLFCPNQVLFFAVIVQFLPPDRNWLFNLTNTWNSLHILQQYNPWKLPLSLHRATSEDEAQLIAANFNTTSPTAHSCPFTPWEEKITLTKSVSFNNPNTYTCILLKRFFLVPCKGVCFVCSLYCALSLLCEAQTGESTTSSSLK